MGRRSSGLVPGSQRAFLRERWSQPGIQGIPDRAIAVRRSGRARFAGFAAVVLQDVRAAGDELERAVSQLGFKGAMINGYSNIGDMDTAQYLDEPVWDFWARVKALDVPSTCIAFLDDALIFGEGGDSDISSPISGRRGQERQARPLVVGCSTETGSDAGKVFLRASSSASSWRLRLSLSPSS